MTKMNGIKMKDAEKQSKMAQNLQTGSYLKTCFINSLHFQTANCILFRKVNNSPNNKSYDLEVLHIYSTRNLVFYPFL